jgi:hypothetical protein
MNSIFYERLPNLAAVRLTADPFACEKKELEHELYLFERLPNLAAVRLTADPFACEKKEPGA